MARREITFTVRDIPEVKALVDEMQAAIARVRELHQRDVTGFCRQDGFSWPCATIRALDGAP